MSVDKKILQEIQRIKNIIQWTEFQDGGFEKKIRGCKKCLLKQRGGNGAN